MKFIKLASVAGCLCATTGAFAQSSVGIQGVVDSAVTRISGGGIGHKMGLSNGGDLGGRLIFRGAEDLGGGMAASFWMEGTLMPDDGNAAGFLFQRRSTLSLSGNFGEIRLGRDYAPSYWNNTIFDPFNNRGVGQFLGYNNFTGTVTGVTTAIDEARNTNAVSYFLPGNLGGIYGQFQYSFGGQPAGEPQSNAVNSKNGVYAGGRLGYASGPLNVAIAAGEYRQVGNAASATVARGNLDLINIGAWYDFGILRLQGFYGQEKMTGFAPGRRDSAMIAAVVPFGASEVRASYSSYDLKNSPNDFSKLALGYGYNLSKRTKLYATVATLRNKGTSAKAMAVDGLTSPGVAPGRSSNGFDLGIRHTF